jgi:hypothetical protein
MQTTTTAAATDQAMAFGGDANDDEEADDEFFSALNRARETALSKQRKTGASTLALQVKSLKSKEGDVPTSGLYKGEIFTEASEFCNSISAKDQQSTKEQPGSKSAATAVPEAPLPGEKPPQDNKTKTEEEKVQQ